MLTKSVQGLSILLIPLWAFMAYLSVPLITGVEIISPVRAMILSSKNALFFFNIIAIAMAGGYLASRHRSNKPLYIAIQVSTFAIVIFVAWFTSSIQHSHGWG